MSLPDSTLSIAGSSSHPFTLINPPRGDPNTQRVRPEYDPSSSSLTIPRTKLYGEESENEELMSTEVGEETNDDDDESVTTRSWSLVWAKKHTLRRQFVPSLQSWVR